MQRFGRRLLARKGDPLLFVLEFREGLAFADGIALFDEQPLHHAFGARGHRGQLVGPQRRGRGVQLGQRVRGDGRGADGDRVRLLGAFGRSFLGRGTAAHAASASRQAEREQRARDPSHRVPAGHRRIPPRDAEQRSFHLE